MQDNMIFLFVSIVGVIVILQVALSLKHGETKRLMALVQALVNEAEVKYGNGTGKLKYEYVVDRVYSIIPWYVKAFVSEELLDNIIESAVDNLQEYLEKATQ